MKVCTNMYLHNLQNPSEYHGHKLKVKVTWVFFLHAWYCLNQSAWIHEMPFARWSHFITARGSDWGYPRAVLSLEQGFTILISSYDTCWVGADKLNTHVTLRLRNASACTADARSSTPTWQQDFLLWVIYPRTYTLLLSYWPPSSLLHAHGV